MLRAHLLVLVVLAPMASLALPTSESAARIWTVRPDGTGDAPTIQAAIDLASDLDAIELTDGTFTGEGNRDLDPLGKVLQIRSQSGDPRSCRIDCEGSPGAPHRAFYIHSGEGYETVLRGVWIVNGYAESGGGALIEASTPTFRECAITGCKAEYGGAVRLDSEAYFMNVTIAGNLAYRGGGFFCSSGAHAPPYASVEYSIVWGNCADRGNQFWLEDGAMSFECDCFNPADGDGTPGSFIWFSSWTELDPRFCGARSCYEAPSDGGDYTLTLGSPCLPESSPFPKDSPCHVLLGAFGQGCAGPVPVVEQTWGRIKRGFLERPAGSR